MSRWFRFYGDALNDPKVQRLSGDLFKAWVNLLCLMCNHGKPFDLASAAFALRTSDNRTSAIIDDLLACGLLDDTEHGLVPHNWDNRQYKSDVSNQRVSKYREKKRNDTCNVTVTPPETEQNRNTEPSGSDACASFTPEAQLWKEGLPMLLALGVKESQARPMIGRWLRESNNDHLELLRLISVARQDCPHGPIAWITASLKPRKDNGKPENLSAAARRLATEGLSFGPKPSLVPTGTEGVGAFVRMLPKG